MPFFVLYYLSRKRYGINIAEWSSPVARRAHNPKVMWFKSHLRNQKKSSWSFDQGLFSLCAYFIPLIPY